MISESKARDIASQWHGGQTSSLYAFSSSGTIDEGLESEIEFCMNNSSTISQVPRDAYIKELSDLLEYVRGQDASEV